MSYDLEILVKIENGDYICIAEPKYSSPTYNLGTMFRKLKIIEKLYFRTRYKHEVFIHEVVKYD